MTLAARIVTELGQIPEQAWDDLHGGAHPFIQHRFLCGLERSDCLQPSAGWSPHHITLWDDGRLVAAAPCYQKTNSHGEFVFDYAWAQAHEQLNLNYYPKLLCAVPYSPITGPRLLCADVPGGDYARQLMAAMVEVAQRGPYSSAHLNFIDADTARRIRDSEWLLRQDVQFHWQNEAYADWEDFLGRLNAKRRKEVRRERAQVLRDGWRFEWRQGHQLDEAEITQIHALYQATFLQKGNHPALTLSFFRHLARSMPEQTWVVLGFRNGAPEIGAMAFCLRDAHSLYGRYWGAYQPTPGLHFEICYYQGIEYCIAQGLRNFEPGAQGEHKIARGFMPVKTLSAHWIKNGRLRLAIIHALKSEASWLAQYIEDIRVHSPYAHRPEPCT